MSDSATTPVYEPLWRDQRKIDNGHLRILAICHFCVAGFALMGLAFLGLHYAFMHWIFDEAGAETVLPAMEGFDIFSILVFVYYAIGFLMLAVGVANLLSGLFMLKRKNRSFSLVVAGLDCLQFPFGTLLGVFTLTILSRDTVQIQYNEVARPLAPAPPVPPAPQI